jgi:hypothetical protein
LRLFIVAASLCRGVCGALSARTATQRRGYNPTRVLFTRYI